jgi:hypothetical protein
MKIILPILFLLFLSGCITIDATEDPKQSDDTNIDVDSAPVITGTPAKTVEIGSYYNFLPSSYDAEEDSLSYNISNKPSWSTFNTQTGELFGTPNEVRMHDKITISVSDGTATTSLSTFNINVTDTLKFNVKISWKKPLLNTDGSPLNNISMYKIMYGSSPGEKENTIYFDGTALAGTIENLSSGDYFFSMATITNNALESDASDTFYFYVSN